MKSNLQSNKMDDLLKYFTDADAAREDFLHLIKTPFINKNVFVILGLGGTGKSTLLRMFSCICKDEKIPSTIASSDQCHSEMDFLIQWVKDLKLENISFPNFDKEFTNYQEVNAKVSNHAKAFQKKEQPRHLDLAGKTFSKTAEASGSVAGAVLGSFVPAIGSMIGGVLGGVIVGVCTEVFVDWLRKFLSKPEVDLFMSPVEKLTSAFQKDIEHTSMKNHIVLMIDAFEKISTLNDWVCNLAQNFPDYVLLVLAGRTEPKWERIWPEWRTRSILNELSMLSEENMRLLVQRYYACIQDGNLNKDQVESIIHFSKGLPLAGTSAVQLWVRYKYKDFKEIKPEITANLVDRLIEGVPKSFVPYLEAASIVRWFDLPILRAVTELENVEEIFNELRQFPFVYPRAEGFAVHDSIRDILNGKVLIQDQSRYRKLHKLAEGYFIQQIENEAGGVNDNFELERLYHFICADEKKGMQLFQEIAEKLTYFRLVNRLRVLLNDANTYQFTQEINCLWRNYYNAKLSQFEEHQETVISVYSMISENSEADSKLRGYCMSDLGFIYKETRYVMQQGGLERVIQLIENSQIFLPEKDPKHVQNIVTLGEAYERLGELGKASKYFQMAISEFTKAGNLYGIASILHSLIGDYGRSGDWKEMFAVREKSLKILPDTSDNSHLRADLLGYWGLAWVWAGRYHEAEAHLLASLEIKKRLNESTFYGLTRDLIFATGVQDKFGDAANYFRMANENYHATYGCDDASSASFYAYALFRDGNAVAALDLLNNCLDIRIKKQDYPGMPENYVWLGNVYEILDEYKLAEINYKKSQEFIYLQRHYFECGALMGIIRAKFKTGEFEALQPIIQEAIQIAQRYEYNDYLSMLYLYRGHLAWQENQNSIDSVVNEYKISLIYALRYNRFLLDEILNGRPQGTILNPVIPSCMTHGEKGKEILNQLFNWWQKENNEIYERSSHSISPIKRGIGLLAAENFARLNEPGNLIHQTLTSDQIQNALRLFNRAPSC